MERFLENHRLFTFSRSEWVWQIRNDQLLLQPVFAREFMKDLVWKRGEHYLISSATILDPQEYIKLNGLTDFLKEDEIAILQVPSIFPAENRPIIDATVGVLSKQQWEHNMPLAVATVEQILRKERGNVAIHCYDKKTRVLTKRGFRHFSELTYRDQIATLNPKTGYLEYHKPRRIINYEHDGPMYEFRSRNIDLMVTPEHRLWVAPVYARKDLRKYRFSTPAELFSTSQKGSSERHYFAVKRTALWKGKGSVKKIVLPGGKRIQIDDWLRFLGWYLAEGTHRKAGVDRDYGLITLSQSLHSPYLSEIESLVKRLGFKHGKYLTKKDNVVCFNIYSDVLEAVLKPLGDHAQEKTMPQQVKELPPEKLRILFEALMKGDGHLRFSDGGYPQWQFTTTSDRLSDDMFEIGLKLGMAVSEYSFDRTSYRPSRIKGRVISPKHRVHVLTFSTVKQCATICTSDSKGRKYAKPKLVQYRGSVGCVDVKNHVIFVERNGNACWSGNCHSYRHQRALVANLSPDLKHRLIVHTGKDREEKLREWMRSRGKVFVSVAFNEGQDWKYDICLVPDEEIMTSEGVKKISDVRTGDRVLTHKGRFRKVKDVKTRNYNGKVISIAPYYTAQPFRVTTQHPILTDKGWVNAEQIVDECIAYPRLPSSSKSVPRIDLTYEVRRRGFHKCEISSHTAHYFRENIQLHRELSPSEMRLCGYYLAEGSLGQHQVILYFGKTARELEYARDAARLFRELFNRKASIRHTEYGNAVVFGSINAAKWFSSMFGQRAIEKKIPTSWLYSDDKHIVELLRGYFRGDGNHYENVFRAITASITLAHEIRLLLARFGIVATVSMRKGGKRTIQGRMANTHTRYPISISRTQAVQAFQLLGEKLTVRRKRSFKVKATICNDYIYSQIHNKSTSHYSGKVYNLEVEEDNSYVGVSCIYHNCDAQILLKVPFADIGDMRVKRRLELGQRQWYENQAMLEAIQAYGRAIRAEDDIARFYVVDGSFISLVRNTWQFIPDWFKAALPPTFTI
jgi:intein/homing endonuclease